MIFAPAYVTTWQTGNALFCLHRQRGQDHALAGVAFPVLAAAVSEQTRYGR